MSTHIVSRRCHWILLTIILVNSYENYNYKFQVERGAAINRDFYIEIAHKP